jgi:hypothetical protein
MIDDDSSSRFEHLVRGAAPSAFAAGFADRVLTGVRASREQPLSAALERQFVRIVPLAAAAALLLASYNWWGAHDSARNALEAALNLPQVTIATAYSVSENP